MNSTLTLRYMHEAVLPTSGDRIVGGSGTGWNKSVELTQSFQTGQWYQVLAWIRPGVEIGLCVNAGAPEVTALGSGQAAYEGNGQVALGSAYDGRIDEIAVLHQRLDAGKREFLYQQGDGRFWDSVSQEWTECVWESSSSDASSSESHSSEESHSSHSSEEPLPQPAAYYNCNEANAWDALEDSVGSLDFDEHGNPTALPNSGICQGARQLDWSWWFQREHNAVFNPGTSAPLVLSLWFQSYAIGGYQVLVSKTGEYELILDDTGQLIFRIATGAFTGWDESVELSDEVTSYQWHHALAWIEPGVEIGLSLDGGEPQTTALSAGQAAYSGDNDIYLSRPPPEGSSQSSESYLSSESAPPSEELAMQAAAAHEEAETEPFVGELDEIAVFNELLDSEQRERLWSEGDGVFWRSSSGWVPCPWSFAAASITARSAAAPQTSAQPVSAALLALAQNGEPTRTVAQYVWGARPNHRDELVLRDRDTDDDGELDERHYCLMDYYDPTSITNTEGQVVERYDYSAFGIRQVLTPDFTPRATTHHHWTFAFHGQFLDPETGYYNYGYRYYVPWLGRWPSRDPIGEPGSKLLRGEHPKIRVDGELIDDMRLDEEMNLYHFVFNNPINRCDYLGLGHNFGRCCNRSNGNEWALLDGIWRRLTPGECTGILEDCDGMTCGGGFYYVSALEWVACATPGCDSPPFDNRRWEPGDGGDSGGRPPGGEGGRGSIEGNTPPGYNYGSRPACTCENPRSGADHNH